MTSDPVLALSKVLAPSSCLFIGPSRDVSKYTGRPLTLMEKWGYGGEIGIVHRGASGSDWGGQWPVYATIEAACRGRSWDAAMVLVPGSAVADVIDEAANGGVGAAVVIASSLDIDKERVLARGLPILGPNTFGTYATFSDTPLTFSTLLLEMDIRPGGTMIVTQSGGLGNVVVDLIAAGGGVAAFVGTGDEWSIDAADCLRYAAHQPAVDNVGLLLEGLPRGDIRAAISDLSESGKRCGLLLAGFSAMGRKAAASHTGKMAPLSTAAKELLEDAGAVVFSEPHHLAYWLAQGHRSMNRPAVSIVTLSGGFGVLVADAIDGVGNIPEPSDSLAADLGELVPQWDGTLVVDTGLIGSDRVKREVEILARLLREPSIDAVVWVVAFDTMRNEDFLDLPELLANVPDFHGRLIVCSIASGMPVDHGVLSTLAGLGIPWMRTPSDVSAILANTRARPNHEFAERPFGQTGQRFAEAMPHWGSQAPEVVQDLLARGFRFARTHVVLSLHEAREAAAAMGWPVALKLPSDEVDHKTEAGGLILGITNESDLTDAWNRLSTMLDPSHGRWLQKQVSGGAEFLIGFTRDDPLGGTIVVGLGGQLTELLRDNVYLSLYESRQAILAKLRQLRVAPLFQGFRGLPPVSADLLADAVETVAAYARTDANLVEFELNPVVVSESDCVPVDVLRRIRRGQ